MKYANLQECLSDMKLIYDTDRVKAVRGQHFIRCLHEYCLDEIERRVDADQVEVLRFDQISKPQGKPAYPKENPNPKKFLVMPEMRVFGSHKNKNVDIVLSEYANGPLITVGIRSEMSSVGKNIANYYEGIIGECISIHDRFPMAVVGYVYILPKTGYSKNKKGEIVAEAVDLDRAEVMFEKITNRSDWRGPKDIFEHFAFLKVDFDQNPPIVIPNRNHDLDLSTFFDKLLATYNSRNFFNTINGRADSLSD